MTGPKRTSSGTFSTAPLLNLQLLALDRKLSGTLVLEAPTGGQTQILLSSGAIIKARPAGPVARLGEMLIELASVLETTVEVAAATRSGPKLLGQKLVEAGVVSRDALEVILREQLLRRVLWAGRLPPSTKFTFSEGVDLLADWGKGPIEIDPLALIWSCIKVNATNQELDSVLSRLTQKDLRLHSRAKTQRFQFASKIQGGLDVLRARPQSLESLIKTNLVDSDTLRRVVYALAVTRHLDLGREDLEPMGVAAGQSRHPAAPRPETRPRRLFEAARQRRESPPPETHVAPNALMEELHALMAKMDSLNYYQLLGIPEEAPASIVQNAFLLHAKKWHPDRWRGELEVGRQDAARVFARISEAHQVLTDEEQRQEYDKLRKSKGQEQEEQETVKQVLRGASLFQKAMVLAKKQDFAGAEELARRAFECDPTQTEYGAFYAWVASQNPHNKSKDFDAWIGLLDRAVDELKNNTHVHFYRAVVLKRAGRVSEAMRDFRWVCDQDPNNVEAARELRLFKMRADETKSDAKRSGTLLNKLFKK